MIMINNQLQEELQLTSFARERFASAHPWEK
jgi:hypothetical protein